MTDAERRRRIMALWRKVRLQAIYRRCEFPPLPMPVTGETAPYEGERKNHGGNDGPHTQ